MNTTRARRADPTKGYPWLNAVATRDRLASLFANLGVLEIDVGAAESAIDHLDRAAALDRGEAFEDTWAKQSVDRVNLRGCPIACRPA